MSSDVNGKREGWGFTVRFTARCDRCKPLVSASQSGTGDYALLVQQIEDVRSFSNATITVWDGLMTVIYSSIFKMTLVIICAPTSDIIASELTILL